MQDITGSKKPPFKPPADGDRPLPVYIHEACGSRDMIAAAGRDASVFTSRSLFLCFKDVSRSLQSDGTRRRTGAGSMRASSMQLVSTNQD